jgi:hypothetical protein
MAVDGYVSMEWRCGPALRQADKRLVDVAAGIVDQVVRGIRRICPGRLAARIR